MFQLLDSDGSNTVPLRDIQSAFLMLVQGSKSDKLVAAFNLFDSDGGTYGATVPRMRAPPSSILPSLSVTLDPSVAPSSSPSPQANPSPPHTHTPMSTLPPSQTVP
jgi:hypothetical protein